MKTHPQHLRRGLWQLVQREAAGVGIGAERLRRLFRHCSAVIHLAVPVSPDPVVAERTRRTKSPCRLLFLNLEHERVVAWGGALAEERHVDFDCAADAQP